MVLKQGWDLQGQISFEFNSKLQRNDKAQMGGVDKKAKFRENFRRLNQ
jgi:hypothetical protein